MTRICLNMIVRNEEAIIERCLRAALPFIDCYVILDTGSTDDTVAIIERTIGHLPGVVRHGKFENFEQARNDALRYARNIKLQYDYILLADADMELVVEIIAQPLTAPAYRLLQRSGDLAYENVRLVRRDVPATYVGVTHEYLDLGEHQAETMLGAYFIDHACGSSRADKFERDIQLLLTAPPTPRNLFYLAQSYRDSGHVAEALEAYQWRVDAGGWEEEVWYSMLQIAVLMGYQGYSRAEIDAAYLAAWNYRPTRAEPLVELARRYRERAEWPLAYLVASAALRIPRPDDLLFVDEASYTWRAEDECAIAAYWTGRKQECAWRCRELLAMGSPLPQEQRARVEGNLRHAEGLVS